VLFYFSVFGIACLELFKGKFYNRCGTPNFTLEYIDSNAYAIGSRGTIQVRGSDLDYSSNCLFY
jgi:hypothetical protein